VSKDSQHAEANSRIFAENLNNFFTFMPEDKNGNFSASFMGDVA
jgi:hypothetical protein